MSVSGRIAIDVEFTDRTTTAAGSSLNTITLRDATEYATGKVAIVTGTCGTAAVNIDPQFLGGIYRDASGTAVTFPLGASRVAFSASRKCKAAEIGNDAVLVSDHNRVAVSDMSEDASNGINVSVIGTAGTASFTLVLYGT
jgi:hypothetical protein